MDRKIKYLMTFAISCIAAFAIISVIPANGEEKIYENVVRLHVIANSDSNEDQRLKLAVRDAILEKIKDSDADSVEEAVDYIKKEESSIQTICNNVLKEKGSDDSVRLILGRENYPVRYYDSFALPSGDYISLRVVIGEGDGHNWWCVLYPPLCTAASEEECEEEYIAAGFTGEEYKLIKKESGIKYKIKFKLLEIISEAFGFDY